jgi:hypothetical protein
MTTSLRLVSCWVLVYLLGTPCVLGQAVQFVPGSTTPRVQLTGEHFQIYSNGKYFTDVTPAQTLSRFGVLGTDLGIPVSFADKIVLLFGDTIGVYPSGSQYRQARTGPNGAADAIGFIPHADFSQCRYISDVDQQLSQGVATPTVSSAACPSLSIYTDPARASDGQVFKPMVVSGLLAGESQGVIRVPTGGFAYNDRLYMFYITMIQENPSGSDFSLQSIAARSDQPAASWSNAAPPTFSRLYTVSSHPQIADPANPPAETGDVGKFMFVAPVVMDAAKVAGAGLTQGLPAALQNAANVVFVFGTGWRRGASNMYLAAFSLTDADAGPAKWVYYKGGNQWSAIEAEAAPLLATSDASEQSVVWNSALRRFVLMRTGSASVQAQFSTTPWGPWSDPVNVLSKTDAWVNKLLHHPGADPLVQSLITIYDRNGNPVALPDSETGVPYSPSLLDNFTQNADGSVTLYYTLSTWNPYQVFLMSSTFVIPGTMALDKTSLTFAAVSNGAALTSQTPAQTVRLTQSGAGSITWTATSTAPWLVVSPASGTGPATLSISTRFASGLTASQTGTIAVALTGASNTVGPITVRLTTVSANAPASPPFGVVDTPAGDATVLAGSVAVTGWTLDNIGVQRVELWRDLQPGETTTPFSSTPADPRNGKVFISNVTFVDGARPDIEALYPSTPANYRGGWGYLMLTWGLWNQGNGTYRLHAFAFDQENNVATIGTKTIIVNNNMATKPFGSIDTPTVGGDASGPNFGWGLTPKVNGAATCKIPSNGIQVSIDSGPLQPVVYGDARADIAGAFPGFSNSAAAGGHFIFDWSTLTNGLHTIGWLITDDCNRADGVGSRFFNVTGGASLTAASSGVTSGALRAVETESDAAITVAHGYGGLPQIIAPGEAGSRTVEVTQGDRIEIRVPRGFDASYQLDAADRQRALPTGATWDEAGGIFYWQPAAAFLGRYRLVFSNGTERISVSVVVRP